MLAFIVRRLIYTLIVIILVTLIAFCLLYVLPGDPATAMLGDDATPEQVERIRKQLWLDRPLIIQYGHWMDNLLHGDLGMSITYSENATGPILRALPITAYLAVIAMCISSITGVSIGIISAVKRATFLDNILVIFANLGYATPIFWLGLMGIYVFAYHLGWFPVQGFTWPADDLGKSISQTIMPVICLAVPSIAILARQTRSSMLEVIRQDYIRTARAKGLRERAVILKHALKNALIPVVTLLGILVRILIGGSVLVETVFNIPGLGRLLITSAIYGDFIVVQGGVLIISFITCFANLLVDISYGWLDPRIRFE